MAEDPLVETMELFTGLGLILAFLVFTRLAIKAKGTGSFRFQLSIFMLIWVMAEIPRVANSLGIISTAGFGLYGLAFHMISMFTFALFVGAKSYLFLRTPSISSLPVGMAEPKLPEHSTGETPR